MIEPSLRLVLHEPEIPPNTGNAMRLAANTGFALDLIEPLGFEITDARLRRAGMDYRDKATIHTHLDIDAWRHSVRPTRVFAVAKRGTTRYTDVRYEPGDSLIFGKESIGLPDTIIDSPWIDDVLTIPMQPKVRSLNLSNSVAILAFEAWRQLGFAGAEGSVPPPGTKASGGDGSARQARD